ncbi:unnamed protein product [Chrysodeixis includens]|uniref:Fucosyltransferase n=1 Tax=Chrysodeixis includens TaxID=689277 RepID=A0A9P0FPB7_CHRIL|nr:unnamed protein product [Chrysodeixis includens]
MSTMTHSFLYMFKKRFVKVGLIVILCLFVLMICGPSIYDIQPSKHPVFSELDTREYSIKVHRSVVQEFYENRQFWPNSKLGAILFKREPIPDPNPNENRTFMILVWKHWEWLKKRHVENFGKASEEDILSGCSVTNCQFTGEDSKIDTADAVIVHLQKGDIPHVENRNPDQRWIYLTDESPRNSFSLSRTKYDSESLQDIFNWSMTYRSDADVPVPYGRTIGYDEPIMESFGLNDIPSLIPYWEQKQKEVPATILMSNCAVKARNEVLAELKKYVKVDVYGGCSDVLEHKNSCPGHFKADCDPISTYLFYLVLENSNCFQYLTEKVFYNAYSKGAVPIIYGPSKADCETLLPPNSYLYIDKMANVEDIAKEVLMLSENIELYLSMHLWRNNFQIVNEHGYFGTKSYHLCRICEALNYNDGCKKVYSKVDIDWYLNSTLTCKRM